MKKKQILSLFALMALLLAMLGGCAILESTDEAAQVTHDTDVEPETEAVYEMLDIDARVYPADLKFVEYAELSLPEETESEEAEETTEATEAEESEEDTEEEKGPEAPPVLAFRYYEKTDASGKDLYRVQVQLEAKQEEPADASEDESVEETTAETTAETVAETTAETTAETEGETEEKAGSGISVFCGTLYPGEQVQWDAPPPPTRGQAVDEEEKERMLALLENLETALMDDLEWNSCMDDGVYGYNQEMTKCVISGNTVVYTDDRANTYQIQSYNDDGTMSTYVQLARNSAITMVEGAQADIVWDGEMYTVMKLALLEETVQEKDYDEDTWVQAHFDEYEDDIATLKRLNKNKNSTIDYLWIAVGVLTVTNLIFLVLVLMGRKRKPKKNRKGGKGSSEEKTAGVVKGMGTVHNIGARGSQQDSFDVINCSVGTLAVVADGMGGLSDGDKVSQKIVSTMRADSTQIRPGQTDHILCQMVAHVNQEVNRMLGASRQYKCGSTLLAVLIENNAMQWVTVGDSRIYLYRGGSVIQLNREHIYSAELMEQAVNGKMGFRDALRDPQADRLSSFVGMGDLKHVDMSMDRLKLREGDRILLMSDGVFNTLNNEEICTAIQCSPDTAAAAKMIEQRILSKNMPNQDNFTCVILEV